MSMKTPHNFLVNVEIPVFCLAFTPDNKLIVGGGGGPGRTGVNNKIILYSIDAPTEKLEEYAVRLLPSDEDAPMCLSVHPSVMTVAFRIHNTAITISTGILNNSLIPAFQEPIIACGINSQEKAIKAGNNKNVRIFKYGEDLIEPVESVQTIGSRDPTDYQKVARFSHDGAYLVTGTTDGRLTVLEYPSLKVVFPPVNFDKREVLDADVDIASQRIITVTSKTLRLLSAKDGSVLQTVDNPMLNKKTACEFRACRFGTGRTSDFLFTVVNPTSRTRGFISKWRADTLQKVKNEGVSKRPITAFTISSQGHLLAYASSDLVVGIVDTDTLTLLVQIKNAHGFPITSLAFSPKDKILVSGSADKQCRVLDMPLRFEKEPLNPFMTLFYALLLALIGFLIFEVFDPAAFVRKLLS